MKKQTKNTKWWTKKKTITAIAGGVVVALVLIGIFFGVQKVRYYNDAANQASMVSIRELILLAVRGLKKDAPVDPRTGDIYFPEARLYLPNPDILLPLTYLFDKGNVTDSQGELSISTYPVRGTQALYSARNNTELFTAVPKLQACSRGIKLVHQKFPQNDAENELVDTVHLSDGQDVYIYVEKACPDLNDTADLFRNIQAY